MSLSTAALAVLVEKGLSASDILEVALANDTRADPTAAERMRRYRAKKNGVTVTRNVTPERPLNDIYSNPPVPQTANAVSPPFSEIVISAWNGMAERSGATPSRKLNSSRQAHLRARVKENSEADVLQAIANVGGSKFHCGENDRGWKINLGWMLKSADNFDKCMELAAPAKQPSSGKQWTPEERAEYLAGLERREAEQAPIRPPDEPPRNRSGPRPIGQVVRITNQSQDQAA